jgi:two-component system sensor histidine kinase CiaH
MTELPLHTTRRHLALLNVAVLCGILTLVALAVYFTQSRAIQAQVDAQLRERAVRSLALLGPDDWRSETGEPRAELAEGYSIQSPDLFELLVNARGDVLHSTLGARFSGLPDAALTSPVLAGQAPAGRYATVEASVGTAPRADYRLYALPERQAGHIIGALVAGTSLEPRESELHQFVLILIAVGAAGLLLSGIGGLFLADRALVPIRLAFERQRAFVTDASHELRTPLSLTKAEAEVLLRDLGCEPPAGTAAPLSEALSDARALAGDLISEVDYMTRLVGDLLLLARVDSGRGPALRREEVDLAAVARDACAAAGHLAAAKGLTLSFAAADTPSGAGAACWVLGDADRLRQLLLILLDNAIRYTPAGGAVRVTLGAALANHPWRFGRERISLTVEDTGMGIAPEHLPHLFERFYRVDKARSRAQGGAGLGLAIAAWIARAHGGAITVRSAPDHGATFTVLLPRLG